MPVSIIITRTRSHRRIASQIPPAHRVGTLHCSALRHRRSQYTYSSPIHTLTIVRKHSQVRRPQQPQTAYIRTGAAPGIGRGTGVRGGMAFGAGAPGSDGQGPSARARRGSGVGRLPARAAGRRWPRIATPGHRSARIAHGFIGIQFAPPAFAETHTHYAVAVYAFAAISPHSQTPLHSPSPPQPLIIPIRIT